MDLNGLGDIIASQLAAECECEIIGDRVRVRTPLIMTDGTVVDIYVVERDGELWVTDWGEAVEWLYTQVWDGELTEADRLIAEEVGSAFTASFVPESGSLERPVASVDEVGRSVLWLAQAVVRLSDRWYIHRKPGSLFPAKARHPQKAAEAAD